MTDVIETVPEIGGGAELRRDRPRVAFVSIGQTPRDDLMPDIVAMADFPMIAEEFGALDELDPEELQTLSPSPTELCLHTRLRSGRDVVLSANAIERRVAEICAQLDQQDFDLIVVLSTGLFFEFRTQTPLLHAQRVIDAWIDALVMAESRIGIVYPLERQRKQLNLSHAAMSKNAAVSTLSGRGNRAEEAALALADCDIIVLHSVSYSEEVGRRVSTATGKPVVTALKVLAGSLRLHLRDLGKLRANSGDDFEARLARSVPQLTRRECEITARVVQGLSNKEIGRDLAISHRTVEIHRAKAMRKLGVTTVSGLIRQVLML